MTIAKNIEATIEKSSWIRKMFEEGARLKAEHGADNVFDFSLGNPNLPPPEAFYTALRDTVDTLKPGDHSYMANVGYADVRRSIAEQLSREYEFTFDETHIVMTVGAAGALNAILKAILDPEDEIITPVPCFVEYGFYAANHAGVLKTAPTQSDFSLDLEAIAAAVSERTKAVLINSPNNPTGQVYSEDSLKALGALLQEKSRQINRTIYLLSDEPYRKIAFDGIELPSIFRCYPDSILATSYSKDLSIPGERIGFAAVSPAAYHKEALLDGLALTNRILGFVNAPALMQRVVAKLQGVAVNVADYQRKRDLLCNGLAEYGYRFVTPPGAFYLFPETPIPDDVEFVQALQQERILTVPGSGFHGPGHFRISFCVEDSTIVNALPGFERVIKKYQ